MSKNTKIHIGRCCGLQQVGKQGDLSGQRNGELLNLRAGETYIYNTPQKAYLIGLIALSPCQLKVGSTQQPIGDFSLQTEQVADVAYIQGGIPLLSDTDVQIQTIIYKY